MNARVLALDIGTKTIGIAVSDPLGWFARPVRTIRRASWAADLEALGQVLQELAVNQLIVGLPLGNNGEMTQQAEYSRKAAEKIQATFPEVSITFVDESLSTQEGYSSLRATGMKRKKRKEVIDQQAAVIFLQEYLDERRRQAPHG
jgi:putative Holliday junction resolvase